MQNLPSAFIVESCEVSKLINQLRLLNIDRGHRIGRLAPSVNGHCFASLSPVPWGAKFYRKIIIYFFCA